jgi:hypothetical protein
VVPSPLLNCAWTEVLHESMSTENKTRGRRYFMVEAPIGLNVDINRMTRTVGLQKRRRRAYDLRLLNRAM